MPPARIRAIRKRVAHSVTGVRDALRHPRGHGGTIREQGRRAPDPAARILLQVIERDPEAVLRALRPVEMG